MEILELENTRTEIKDSMDGLNITKTGENLLHSVSHKIHLTVPAPQKSSKLQLNCNTE